MKEKVMLFTTKGLLKYLDKKRFELESRQRNGEDVSVQIIRNKSIISSIYDLRTELYKDINN